MTGGDKPSRCHRHLCSMFAHRRYHLACLSLLIVLLYWALTQHGKQILLPMSGFVSTVSRTAGGGGRLLVATPTCQIPDLDPFDPALRAYLVRPDPIHCQRDRAPPLTRADADSVYLLPERAALYGARPPEINISCCTRDISWNNDLREFTAYAMYDKISVSARCRRLVWRYTPAWADGVEVLCAVNGSLVYRDYHHLVPLRPALEAASVGRRPDHVRPSVLLFMFDSMSRLQFRRWLPRSRAFLTDTLGALELAGLNKHGDNTWPNVVRLLTGLSEAELRTRCAPDERADPLDSCPFLWHDFKRAGYRTAMAEDAPAMGAFNYHRLGFDRQPTDYYSRPTALLSDRHIAHQPGLNTHLCEGGRPSYISTFRYAEHVATRFADRPFWAFVAQSSYTHDFFNMPHWLDAPYLHLLRTLHANGALNSTVLVTLGDHGLRWGEVRHTFVGALEERLPLVSIYLPDWLRRRYPAALQNLRLNQHRLTTFADVRLTLLDLLRAEQALGGADSRSAPAAAAAVSLFNRVSPYRRCQHVHVPAHFCTCLRAEALSVRDGRAAAAAAAVLAAVNLQLRVAPQCARLTVRRVQAAWVWREAGGGSGLQPLTTVQLVTAPGGGRLEGSVLGGGTALRLSGSVSRLDRYGHLSWCVSDRRLEKYCHCGPRPAHTLATVSRERATPSPDPAADPGS